MNLRTIRWDLVSLILLAVGLRVLLFAHSAEQIGMEKFLSTSPDTVNYVSMASGLVEGSITNERGFFTFGPGYAFFLAIFFFLFGIHALPVIIFQILLSSVSCVLIYRLAMLLTKSYPIAMLAGFLAATSYTSISLSCLLLSDTLYFFLFLSGLLLFLEGLQNEKTSYYILSGILIGYAILTRSIGQFFPLVMAAIAFVAYRLEKKSASNKPTSYLKKKIRNVSLTIVIIAVITFTWMVRNYVVHGIPVVSAAGRQLDIAAIAYQEIENKPIEDIKTEWTKQYKQEKNVIKWSYEHSFLLGITQLKKMLLNHPATMIKTYCEIAWNNLNEINNAHRMLLPRYNFKTVPWEHKIREKKWNYLNFILSVVGLLILLATRKFEGSFILGSIYFYYAALIGLNIWQGSRIFFPGQIAWTVLIAITIVTGAQGITKGLQYLRRSFFSPATKNYPT